MVLAMALAAAWAVARIERRGVTRGRVIALAVLCLLMPLTHYFAVTVVATLALYAAVGLRGERRRAVLTATIGAGLLFVIAWSPVLYLQKHGASGRGTTIFVDTEPNHWIATAERIALLPARCLYEPLPRDHAVSMIFGALWLLPLLMLRRRRDLLPWTIWLPMNAAPALYNDLSHPSWTLQIARYTFFATPAVYALIASIGTSLRPAWRYLLPTLAVVGGALHVDQAYFLDDRTSQDWRRLAAIYREIARPGDLTIFAAAQRFDDNLVYYLCIGRYAWPFPGPVLLLDRPASPELLAEIRRYPRVLLIGDGRAAEVYLPAANATILRAVWFLGQISRLEFPQSAPAAPKTTTAPAATAPPPPPAAGGSASHTAPKSRAITTPRR
jgi:hypothetical protein